MIGNKLRVLRDNKELSREQFADKIDVCAKTYSKYENNESYPPHKIIEKIADFYKIKPSDLEYENLSVNFNNSTFDNYSGYIQTLNIHQEKLNEYNDLLKAENQRLKKELEELKKK